MRIGMMTDAYKPHVSGITTYIDLNKRHLEKLGHEVYVFTFGDEGQQDDEARVIRSPGMALLDTGYFINLRYSKPARRLLYTMDVVHVHHPFLSGSLALRYCRPRAIPVIFTNHTRYDLYAQAYLPAVPDAVGEAALQVYLPPFCRSCDLVVAPSAGMRSVLARFGVDVEVEVVPNGLELAPFLNPTEARQRGEVGFGDRDVILVYSGRLGPEKNLVFLLRAFNGAAQAYEDIRLLILGDGPERDNLQDRARVMGIQERVHFAGMVPYRKMPGYLAMADAFVTASVTEVHPFSLIEAMAAGLPALGIRSPGVGDTIQDGKTGFLVQEVDLAAFTAKMVRLATRQEERQEMGRRSRQESRMYAIERTTGMMLERYHQARQKASARKSNLRVRLTRLLDGWWR